MRSADTRRSDPDTALSRQELPPSAGPVPPTPQIMSSGQADPPPTAPRPISPPEVTPQPAVPQDALGDQPWLRMEFATGDDDEEELDADDRPHSVQAGDRLIRGVQGWLAPIRISSKLDDEELARSAAQRPPRQQTTSNLGSLLDLNADHLRRVRALMAEEPSLTSNMLTPTAITSPTLRIGWIFILVALALGVPTALLVSGPISTPMQWPGVEEAYTMIQHLPPNSLVLVDWAYDPATAGELDLAALPVMRHLLTRRARLAVVSLLPAGPATARRLIARAQANPRSLGGLVIAAESTRPIPISYLSGGAAALPLIAQNPLLGFKGSGEDQTVLRNILGQPPVLAVIMAAETENVQDWLEQVQPLNGAPVIAITSAAADPTVRPYRDSGQLSGLVSGFDGAYAYQKLLNQLPLNQSVQSIGYQVVLQNWGLFAVLALIVLGNLVSLFGRPGDA